MSLCFLFHRQSLESKTEMQSNDRREKEKGEKTFHVTLQERYFLLAMASQKNITKFRTKVLSPFCVSFGDGISWSSTTAVENSCLRDTRPQVSLRLTKDFRGIWCLTLFVSKTFEKTFRSMMSLALNFCIISTLCIRKTRDNCQVFLSYSCLSKLTIM
jgi:hypothetical protein